MIKHYQYKKVCAGRDYLQANYADPFSLSEVADHACMSQFHFSRVFTSVFGESPNSFVTRLRVEKAKKLLITKSLSVSDVCEIVGYRSIGSFSSLFRAKVGMSPAQYRKRISSLSNEPHRFPMQTIPLCFAQNLFGYRAEKQAEDSKIEEKPH